MDSKEIKYFIDGGEIRVGVLVGTTENEGQDTLYNFGHGFSTTAIYDSEEKAVQALKKQIQPEGSE